MKTVAYKVSGMHCMGCVGSVKRVLERQAGIERAEVSLELGKAEVVFDDALINDDKIVELIKNLGYEVEVN